MSYSSDFSDPPWACSKDLSSSFLLSIKLLPLVPIIETSITELLPTLSLISFRLLIELDVREALITLYGEINTPVYFSFSEGILLTEIVGKKIMQAAAIANSIAPIIETIDAALKDLF